MNYNNLKEKPSRYISKPLARPLHSKNPELARAEVEAIRKRGMIDLAEAQKIAAYGLKSKQMAFNKGKIKVQ